MAKVTRFSTPSVVVTSGAYRCGYDQSSRRVHEARLSVICGENDQSLSLQLVRADIYTADE